MSYFRVVYRPGQPQKSQTVEADRYEINDAWILFTRKVESDPRERGPVTQTPLAVAADVVLKIERVYA